MSWDHLWKIYVFPSDLPLRLVYKTKGEPGANDTKLQANKGWFQDFKFKEMQLA